MKHAKVLLIVGLLLAASFCGCTQQSKVSLMNANQKGKNTNAIQNGQGNQNAQRGHGRGMGMGAGRSNTNTSPGFNLTTLEQQLASYPAGNLTPVEKEDLLHMIQEEKLAHDVYVTLYNKWKLPIFENIARSESTHMAAVAALLKKYNITNPVANMGVGEFANSTFTQLYNKLVEEGSTNITSALKVGALIEDLDIHDLQVCINQTNKQDIKLVYSNLMKGSRNHMRAFVSMLKRYGESYTPKYISQQEFEQIISTPTERGPSR